MSGAEVAGIVLAVLPLVVNQLDTYARGLETIKGLRRYRWELEGYSSTLSAQYAIFLNTLEIFLQDVVDDHDERSGLISNPNGPGWKDAQFRKGLAEKLGRDYNAFTGTVTALCSLLEEVSNKLGRHTLDYSKAASINSLGSIRFRKILSKAIYEDILNKIDKVNQILKTLSDQSYQLDQARKGRGRWERGLKGHRDSRRHARVLYDILVRGQGWKCPCRNDHTVCFRLDLNTIHSSRNTEHPEKKTRFLIMLSSANKEAQRPHTHNQWYEIELQPELIEQTVPTHLKERSTPISEGKRKVQFVATSSTTICVETRYKGLNNPGPIGDLCSTLSSVDMTDPHVHQEFIGYILNQSSDARYNIRLLRSMEQDINLHSLQEILAGSPSSLTASIQDSDELSRRDRLYLAAVLACGVLQLHGSWLKQQWGTKDVLFAQNLHRGYTTFDHPYLVWHVIGPSRTRWESSILSEYTASGGHRIQNEILLPLAVALIELSLGKTISALYRPEDKDSRESQLHFNTATRVLRSVYCESGSSYGDVVKECLYWSRSKGERFEDPQFDECVFDTVVSPLLKDLDYFEGISHMK
ncbi:conserved hypothetical protein [Talaromyces stipitatus ATCC 10500]|uniref:DUF7580 domain-containing protein n=1 Tax=Talaromyces stipitatus (strain ATCC 10500 / CBS 375.48 / QM 6759 / NRRL 1006) TaxID=441959 RepID=B8MCC5_TALSN|nr:uncharacterized protein TSTA_123000 [Talaromyces stipitatus ATCC 10500]EED18571.1 conserved hypothetical protein [Talaromyces stipitatus ATCC 10500]